MALSFWTAVEMTPARHGNRSATTSRRSPAVLIVWIAITCPPDAGSFNVDAQVLADFNRRISAYVDLRDRMSQGIRPLADSAKPAEIAEAERRLAERVRSARVRAKHGDVFTTAIQMEFRRLLRSELRGLRGKNTRGVIMDENPRRLALRVNGTYPKTQPLSTVPPNVLDRLPPLPRDLEYRFVRTHLILRDARTNLIVDYVRNAIP
jgi:hypothetical protein